MRKSILWCSLISAALLGGACKQDPSDQAADQVRKSVEEVREQREDLREERKDVVEEQRELSKAEGELAKARANYIVTTRERLAKIDARINDLELRADAKAKDAAVGLRARRDMLAAQLDQASNRIDASDWDDFRGDLEDTFKQIEKDVDRAFD
jgi:septal ring factor EnvC (AmiA/AmiB activator)